jgi:DHA1 family tetracycline resistance protein-like MFS transporter
MKSLAAAEPRRSTLIFVFVTVVLDVLALGIIIPVLPNLVKDFQGGDTAAAARVIGLLGSLGAAVQFFAAPVLGAISDRIGRRPVILFSCAGLALSYMLIATATSLAALYFARVITGIASASYATASAYIADVTAPEKRAASFGMLGAAFGLGFVAGPALGGVLGEYSVQLPFWVAAGLCIANVFYGIFVLPESLSPDKRTPRIDWLRANPVGSFGLLSAHRGLLLLAAVFLLFAISHDVMPSTFVLYGGERYGWSVQDVGFALGAIGIATAVVQGGLIRPLGRLLGERGAVMTGLSMGAIGFTLFGLAPVGWMFLAAVPVQALWGISGPSIQGLMSHKVSPSEQGRLQGALTSMRAIGGIIGPLIFTNAFSLGLTMEPAVPGLALFAGSALLVVAAFVAWRAARPAAVAA